MNEARLRRIREVIARYKAFYASKRPGLMVRVAVEKRRAHLPKPMAVNAINWSDEGSCRAFAESRLEFQRAYQATAPDVDDDDIPKIQNLAGTGAVAASFIKDAVVYHEATTNYLEPPIRDWDRDMARVGFDPENPWYRGQMAMVRACVEAWDGTFGIVPFVHFDPLDLCNQWRGNDLFLDYYDHPEELRALLEKATQCVLELESHLRANYMDGYALEGSCMGCWTPGTYLSCDAGDMSGPPVLAEWGVPFTERIVRVWGGAYLHHHELGIHQIETWSKCHGLTIQFLNRDPNTIHLAEAVTDRHLATSFDVALGFIATYDEFQRHAGHWATGKCIVTVRCSDEAQARSVVERTRRYRNF